MTDFDLYFNFDYDYRDALLVVSLARPSWCSRIDVVWGRNTSTLSSVDRFRKIQFVVLAYERCEDFSFSADTYSGPVASYCRIWEGFLNKWFTTKTRGLKCSDLWPVRLFESRKALRPLMVTGRDGFSIGFAEFVDRVWQTGFIGLDDAALVSAFRIQVTSKSDFRFRFILDLGSMSNFYFTPDSGT